MDAQDELLQINTDEAATEEGELERQKLSVLTQLKLPEDATFASQNVFSKPSSFIRAVVRQLPSEEAFTRDQTLSAIITPMLHFY